ncbi:hypothetical protein FA13DRAFT_213642 [Coprinellus micaceus]|uniref:Uncharacterized protein n=1 Tax=Coprinellus micaceus TaxID=71717 RepID=A0A4Y7TEN7_COPMI|nr:hypothetical protein FA13DRAFT_213642 [Coprinellus micaceus]
MVQSSFTALTPPSHITMPTFSQPLAEINYGLPIMKLARELQHEVLQYIAASRDRKRPALYSFACTCQALFNISLPFIVDKVFLCPTSGVQAPKRRSTLLWALERDAALRSYVKVVTVDFSHIPSHPGTERTNYCNIRRILEWLHSVRMLDLRCHSVGGWRELLVDAEGGFSVEPLRALRTPLSSSALTSLSICGLSFPSTVFSLCPNLKELVLGAWWGTSSVRSPGCRNHQGTAAEEPLHSTHPWYFKLAGGGSH